MHRIPLSSRSSGARCGVAVLVLMLAVSGCDLIEQPEPITLPPITKTMRFEFDGRELQAGTAHRVAAVQAVDLRGDLRALQVAPGEVIAARITQVELERRQPLSVDLGFLSAARLHLTGEGASLAVAENEGGFSSSSRSQLSALSVDVARFVASTGFGAALDLTPNRVVNDDFVLEARVTFVVEVEGV